MDKQNFGELVRENQRRLYRVAMSYTGNVQDASDAVQEALLRAWNRRNTLRDEKLFSAWLMRIVINECKTLLRKRRQSLPYAEVPVGSFLIPGDAQREVFDALFRLPEKYRVPLVLTAVEGFTLEQTAQMLHLPVNTVKTRISRARKKLKQEVADDEV